MSHPGFRILLSQKSPVIMGILNVTPDSFSDGGDFIAPSKALERAEQMMSEGADLIDVGAESSAPYSKSVSASEEWDRIEPVVEVLGRAHIPFSIDTYKSDVAHKCLDRGAVMVNDVTGLRGDEEMVQVLSQFAEAKVCVMYSKDDSARTRFADYGEENVVDCVSQFFTERISFAEHNGISRNRLVLDPGMGAFLSSDPAKSFAVLKRLAQFRQFDCPLLVSTSRKSFLREVSDPEMAKNRTIASVVSSLVAVQNGAKIVRVHDVKEMKESLATWQAIERA